MHYAEVQVKLLLSEECLLCYDCLVWTSVNSSHLASVEYTLLAWQTSSTGEMRNMLVLEMHEAAALV